ncbi:peroxiredoxin-like family protein [Formosa sp. PL04]|uniref:peroxiredoxin-like family protein n=1 Tax=Formosa sp. PL04 TaxID=3081755 RepID=UPI002980EE9B|nr:peroxiredoxin-like family protein [Formosa sp. PL04]MDW5288533.1 peroxiredoxin-like family protein [Formosa sp. PL04]
MIKPRTETPDLTIDLVNGKTWTLSEQNPKHFTMIVVYRGKHCPVCKKYLKTINKHIKDFADKGVNVIAISANTKELATESVKEWEIPNVPVGYNFGIEEARKWGLYISKGIKEEPKEFVEPGLYLIRPDRTLYASSIQTMPFTRPGIEDLLKSLDFVIDKDYPARGEA